MSTYDLNANRSRDDLSQKGLATNSSSRLGDDGRVGSSSITTSIKRIGFVLVNFWLAFHLFAIVICPASVDPASPLVQGAFEQVSPYLHFLYLDHGFHYFAPDPGSSTLIAYSLEFPDGSKKSGVLPNREISPRLYYHRHFMLTEFLGNGPEDLQPLVERAIARNLCRETGATSVSLTKVEHEIPSIEQVREGMSLTDPSLFKETPLATYTVEELRLPMPPKSPKESTSDSPSESRDSTSKADDPKETP